jgi:hypothetical protein
MKAHSGVHFVQAYLPYTVLGQTAMTFLKTGKGWTDAEARAYLRKHPKIADKRY